MSAEDSRTSRRSGSRITYISLKFTCFLKIWYAVCNALFIGETYITSKLGNIIEAKLASFSHYLIPSLVNLESINTVSLSGLPPY